MIGTTTVVIAEIVITIDSRVHGKWSFEQLSLVQRIMNTVEKTSTEVTPRELILSHSILMLEDQGQPRYWGSEQVHRAHIHILIRAYTFDDSVISQLIDSAAFRLLSVYFARTETAWRIGMWRLS